MSFDSLLIINEQLRHCGVPMITWSFFSLGGDRIGFWLAETRTSIVVDVKCLIRSVSCSVSNLPTLFCFQKLNITFFRCFLGMRVACWTCLCACVCACVCASVRASVHVGKRACMWASVRACERVSVRVRVWVCVGVAKGWPQLSSSIASCLRQGLSWNLELIDSAGLASELQRILLFLLFQSWGYTWAPACPVFL